MEELGDLFEVRWHIECWRVAHNAKQPHSSLGYQTPTALASQCTAEDCSSPLPYPYSHYSGTENRGIPLAKLGKGGDLHPHHLRSYRTSNSETAVEPIFVAGFMDEGDRCRPRRIAARGARMPMPRKLRLRGPDPVPANAVFVRCLNLKLNLIRKPDAEKRHLLSDEREVNMEPSREIVTPTGKGAGNWEYIFESKPRSHVSTLSISTKPM